MWAVLLSALTIGYSLITKKDTEENRTPTPTSLRLFGIGDSLSKENRLFVAGVGKLLCRYSLISNGKACSDWLMTLQFLAS